MPRIDAAVVPVMSHVMSRVMLRLRG